jgi:acetyl-CoA/propionyl-CoA carboxylase, biotin carboxylase, biotin carboxyl carrier protein
VVVSTRDCSLQRRHQKLVEEAPAPFLTDEQNAQLYAASKAILRGAGYYGAGTCEFLVGQDGTISFLEVNTRLQVEHPVSEEVTGLDLVREMFRIAEGQPLGYDDPPIRGHSIEFRINGEDAGRNFLPMPGPVVVYQPPSGPGVRVDSGVEPGSVIGQNFDSLLSKLIVSGASRQQALERARRALAEYEVEGLATVIPFHRAVVSDPAFAPADPAEPFRVHTRWIETEWDNTISPFEAATEAGGEPAERQRVTVEVDGKRLEVALPASLAVAAAPAAGQKPAAKRAGRRGGGGAAAAASGDALASPMQGTIVKIAVSEGDQVEAGDLVVVLEAMKMEQPLNAHRAGTIAKLSAEVGTTVSSGAVICEIND